MTETTTTVSKPAMKIAPDRAGRLQNRLEDEGAERCDGAQDDPASKRSLGVFGATGDGGHDCPLLSVYLALPRSCGHVGTLEVGATACLRAEGGSDALIRSSLVSIYGRSEVPPCEASSAWLWRLRLRDVHLAGGSRVAAGGTPPRGSRRGVGACRDRSG
jgi:hypothetical protein